MQLVIVIIFAILITIMGTPVPPGWPDLEDDKFYRVGLDCYQDMTGKTGCDQTFQQRVQCCLLGGVIKAWIAAGVECQSPWELCVFSGFTAQRLVFIHGPYADRDACFADL